MPKTVRKQGSSRIAEGAKPPLSREQVQSLFDLSREDKFFHPLIVTAACTGMRLGDVCNLKWSAVDLDAGSIVVTTTRTNQQTEIPILLPLRTILTDLHADSRKTRGLVFPEAAHRYNFKNQHGIHSLRGYLLNGIKALIGRTLGEPTSQAAPRIQTQPPSPDDVAASIQSAGFAPRKAERLITTYRLFAEGQSYSQISAITGHRKGQCSEDLKAIERLIGQTLRPGTSPKAPSLGGRSLSDLVRTTRRNQAGKPQSGRNRQISVYGSRSFRTVFCMLAMDAGVSTAIIERIVGRRTATAAFDQAIADGDISGMPQSITTRALALARDVIAPGQAALVNAVLQATGINGTTDPKRILSLLSSAVMEKTKSRIRSALNIARIKKILKDD